MKISGIVSTIIIGIALHAILSCSQELHTETEYDSSTISDITEYSTLSIRELDSIAYDTDNTVKERLYAFAFMTDSIFHTTLEYTKALPYLNDAYRLWESEGRELTFDGYNPVSIICSHLGICAYAYEINFEKAVKCYIDGAKSAMKNGNMSDFIIIGSNLVWLDFLRKDPSGTEFAEEIHEYGKKTDDLNAKFFGSYNLALMNLVSSKYDKALEYLDEAQKYTSPDNQTRQCMLNCTHAEVMKKMGKISEAKFYFEKSIKQISELSSTAQLYLYLSYSTFLNQLGQYGKALELLNEGLTFADSISNHRFKAELYHQISITYSGLRNWEDAYKSHIEYKKYSDIVYNISKEWSINELKIKYESARMTEQLQKSKIQILSRNRIIIISLFSTGLVLVILTFLTIHNRHRNRMYRSIVLQYDEAKSKEKKLETEIARLNNLLDGSITSDDSANNPKTSFGKEKSTEIFEKLEKLMKESHIYREQDLSRERLAELAGTNRTYLTRVINDNTNGSFAQYIYSYRLDEALKILSEPELKVPLKAIYQEVGFSSNNTFYKLFREKMGMTPSIYRENILKINTEKHSH